MKTLLIVIITIVTCIALHAQEKLYNAGFSAGVFYGVTTPDLDAEAMHSGFEVLGFATRNLGFGARTTLEEIGGHLFENAAGRVIWRVPFEKHSLGFFGGAERVFHDDTYWALELGPEYTYRPFGERVEFFWQIGMRKRLTGEDRDLAARADVGLRFVF